MSNWQPKLIKVVINVGVGKVNKEAKLLQTIETNLSAVTGQRAVTRRAKKAIAGFKSRQGDVVGFSVTLRGKRMKDFVQRLTKIALPADRDFKGISETAIDRSGNLTIGIHDMTTFPELHDQAGSFSHGVEVTLVSSAEKIKSKEFFSSIGIPFQKK